MSRRGSSTLPGTGSRSMSRRRSSRARARGTTCAARSRASSKSRCGSTSPGTVSAPFTENGTRDVAVKVIDDRGNELLVVKFARRGGMSSFEVEEPILNSPFDEPTEHWQIEEGKPPKRAAGRRQAGYFYRDPRGPEPEAGHAARGEWHELELVNLIRERLGAWREAGYPGATRTTLELTAALATRRARAAALLRAARGGGDDHLPEGSALGPTPGRRCPARKPCPRASRRLPATPARWRPAPARRR